MQPYADRSPASLRKAAQEIAAWRNDYVDLVNRYKSGTVPTYHQERTALIQRASRIDRLLAEGGGYRFSGGLAQNAFAFEEEPDWPTHRPSYVNVVDGLGMVIGWYQDRHEEEVAKRRHAIYWVDRTLHAILGFPGYLISLVLGFDRRDLSATAGRTLWWLSVAADAVTIWGFGHLLNWW
jgi:hypothetical protein